MNVLHFMDAPELTGGAFAGESWRPWRSVLAAAYGLPVPDAATFTHLAGGREAPSAPVRELHAIAGRRGGKTQIAAMTGVYVATVGARVSGLLDCLAPGERGVVALVAVDRRQARVALDYVRGVVERSAVLRQMVTREVADGLELDNGSRIEVMTNDYRRIRGRTLIGCIFDESAFYQSDESANPDVELYRAVLPALAQSGGMLLSITTPYAKRGLAYEKWRQHYGKDGDVLVVQGATRDFNPTIDRRIVDEAVAADPEGAESEWLGRFRQDIEAFLQRETVEAAVRPDPLERPYDRACRYGAFADPSGGGADEFSLAVGHRDGEAVVVDALRARRGTPAEIVGEYVELLRLYGIGSVTLDRYAGSWPADEFERHGIKAQTAEQAKSGLYLDALAALNSGRVELPPDDRLVNQFVRLERRTARGGRESIDHPPCSHDDRSNAAAGLVAQMSAGRRRVPLTEWL